MPDILSRETEINKYIENSVQKYWDERNEALLLSYLGSNLKNIFPDSDLILARGLRRHLMTWPIATLVSHPTHKEKIGLIPLSVPVPSDPSALFGPSVRSTVQRAQREYTVFRQDFWNVFLGPLRTRKFVVVTGEHNFLISDKPPEGAHSGSTYEITEDDLVIAPPELSVIEKAKLVRDKIDAWLQRHGLSKQYSSP